jgi:hypothetical protein
MSNAKPDPGGHDGRSDPENWSRSMRHHKHDHGGHNGRNDPANDNEKAIAPAPAGGAANDNGATASAPAGGALTSLAALEAALNSVDTASIAGRSGLPMLQFKREGSGTWMYGQRKTVVEDGSRWAVNVMTFRWGYICFGDGNKVLGERLVSVSLPMPEVTELPNKGFPWQEQWGVNLKCIDGTDAGTEVRYPATTVGGIQAVVGLIEAVRDRLNGGEHDGNISPILRLEKDSYQHPQFGRVWTPQLVIVGWMPLSGPAPAPAPAPTRAPPAGGSAAAEQPRRRRVA